MTDPKLIKEIKAAVSIPVMAKARIGHFVEAQILESLNIDCIDESEVLTPADGMLWIVDYVFGVGRAVHASIILTPCVSFLRQTAITLTSQSSSCLLCAVPAIWVKPCAASTRYDLYPVFWHALLSFFLPPVTFISALYLAI